MSDLENKYRRLSESATLKLSLDNYILLPDSRVKCNITLTPKYNIKLGKLDQELIIKLKKRIVIFLKIKILVLFLD